MILVKHLKGNTYNRAVEYTRDNYEDQNLNAWEIEDMPLMQAFSFDETAEGCDYWADVYNDLKNNK